MSAQAQPQDYARAIYELALETWTRKLSGVQHCLAADPALRSRLSAPETDAGDRLRILAGAVPGGLGETARFLGTLLEAGQLDLLPAIQVEIERLARRRPERLLAQVTSAVELTDAEKQALAARLAGRFGADLELQYKVDPSLLGGVLLRVGDQVIDGTVAGRLSALKDSLLA